MMCRLYRMWINRALDDGRPLPVSVERHLARCATCRPWHERQSSVIRRLLVSNLEAAGGEPAAGAAGSANGVTEVALPAQPSPFLRARILNEIKADSRREAPVSFMRWAWVGAAVAAVALAVVVDRSLPEQASPLVAPHERASASVPNSAADFIEATSRFANGGRLLQVATNLDQPLQKEMHLVLDDARAALRSLQSEFVPGTLLAKRD